MTQDITVVEQNDVIFDVEAIMKKLRTRSVAKARVIIEKLVTEARPLVRPRAGAILSHVTPLEGDQIEVDGVLLTSSLLKTKIGELKRVFPYLATEGTEMAEWGDSYRGAEKIFANAVQQMALQKAKELLEKTILEKYGIPQVSTMNPGSLKIWTITQQAPLFQILGPLPEQLGITLLPTFMMKPEQTSSGIFFQTETKFHNCELCPMDNCPGRKVPFKGGKK